MTTAPPEEVPAVLAAMEEVVAEEVEEVVATRARPIRPIPGHPVLARVIRLILSAIERRGSTAWSSCGI